MGTALSGVDKSGKWRKNRELRVDNLKLVNAISGLRAELELAAAKYAALNLLLSYAENKIEALTAEPT